MHSRGTDPPQPFFNRLGCSRNFGQWASAFGGGTKQEGRGKAAYNALMEDVRLLRIGPELAEALRAGSGPLRQRYGALVAAEDLPLVRNIWNRRC